MPSKALGRAFNSSPAADGKWINLSAAGGIAFSCYLAGAAGDTYTLQEAKDSAGTGAQNLVNITEYYTTTGDGSDAWTRRTQAAAATVVTAAAAPEGSPTSLTCPGVIARTAQVTTKAARGFLPIHR